MKILVIDDERPALELMLETLGRVCPKAEIVSFMEARDVLSYETLSNFDVAFMDIELGRMSGIELALELKKKAPKCNTIFVTSYSHYGTESFRARPSGYVTKPFTDEDIKRELGDLKYPIQEHNDESGQEKDLNNNQNHNLNLSDSNLDIDKEAENLNNSNKLRCSTFGNFIVYGKDGNILNFTRTKSKELLAYLIDCAGFPVTSNEIARDIYEVELDKQMSKNISKIIIGLVDDLKKAGYDDVVIKQNRQIYINKNRVSCDLYDVLNGDMKSLNSFRGEYLIEYSWAEISESVAKLKNK